MTMEFDSIDGAISAVGRGEAVIVTDDEDRENEGDLVMAASKATAEKIAFMVRHTSGILCAPILERDAVRLHLDPMVARNDAPLSTAFTVSVDYRHGLSTGISADERANTVLALASNNTQASDFVRPGHVFPLVARQGGVLVRSGHTEAAVDLAVASGCAPAGVLAELINDDGSLKRLDQLREFAKNHGLKIISIANLIAWRQRREQLIEPMRRFRVDTEIGAAMGHAYRTKFEDAEHLALVFGKMAPDECVAVRIHREKLIEDVFGPQTKREASLLDLSMRRIRELGGGVLIYLRTGFTGVPLDALDATTRSRESARADQWLEIGIGAQILRDLGVRRIRILAGREMDYIGLEGFGLQLDGTEILV